MGADYAIYIEDYVLSYLRREVDSLELSEIFFYGKRQNGSKKLLVYGAGREKEIAAFAKYELLDELVCRLTQAGPVFMVRQGNGEYKIIGFQTFYENNEAMQNYLIEWTSSEGERRAGREPNRKRAQQAAVRETAAAQASFEAEEKKRAGSAMSVQLCLILVVLVAIVISSANSYDKMERLNQSAREVFFAIENQEAGQESGQNNASENVSADDTEQQKKGTEVLVERDKANEDVSVEDAAHAEAVDHTQDNAAGTSDADHTQDGATGTSDASDHTEGGVSAAVEQTVEQDSSEEALSRNITRYYEVERGDTLYAISQKIYGDTSRVGKICELNDISNPDKIHEGQKIILP